MVQSSLCMSHILVLTGYRIVIRYALVIFNFRPAVSNRIFWRNFLEHERKIFEHSWTNHELRVIQLKKPTARKNSSSSFFIKFRLLKIGVKTNGETNFKHFNIGLKLNFTRCLRYHRYSLITLIFPATQSREDRLHCSCYSDMGDIVLFVSLLWSQF